MNKPQLKLHGEVGPGPSYIGLGKGCSYNKLITEPDFQRGGGGVGLNRAFIVILDIKGLSH